MPVYGITQLADIWTRNGGSEAAVEQAVAVSLAESGGDSRAVSPSDDWGLWQINGVHDGQLGTHRQDWYDPDTNARMAILISNNGADWGPWCTAWAPESHQCGPYLGPNLQPGSPAYAKLIIVAGVIFNQQTAPQPPGGGTNMNRMRGAWGLLSYTYVQNLPNHGVATHQVATELGRLGPYLTPPR